jgi:hypothetical protein
VEERKIKDTELAQEVAYYKIEEIKLVRRTIRIQ